MYVIIPEIARQTYALIPRGARVRGAPALQGLFFKFRDAIGAEGYFGSARKKAAGRGSLHASPGGIKILRAPKNLALV